MSGIMSEPIDLDGPRRRKPSWPELEATKGLVVRHRTTGYVGEITRITAEFVSLRTTTGREHTLRNERGAFSTGGKTVTLVPARTQPEPSGPTTTASGSIAVDDVAARVARPSRIVVEGLHDAELVEKVWGDDLRIEGVVVEPLHGADDLESVVRAFGPRPGRRLGVLLDHLVDGTKESRLASTIDHPDVLVTGHPFVDVWQAVKPSAIGVRAWPEVPPGVDWKQGVCDGFGFAGSPGELWRRILAQVSNYADLEPALVGAVEQLIDFVTEPSS